MDRDLENILRELTSELGDLVKVLGSTNKRVIQNTKNLKEEAQAKKRSINSMKDFIKKKKETGSYVEAFGIEVKEATEELTDFERKLEGMPSPLGLLKKAFNFVKDAAMQLGGALIKTAINFGKTDSSIKTLEDAVDAGIEGIDFLGPVAKETAKELDANIEMFRGLAQSGATFGTSILALRQAAQQAGMPLLQFQELIQDNTQVLAKMFGSVNQGVVQFVELGRGLRRFAMDELAGFGITMEDANEFLGTFTELQRAQGRSQGMTAQQLLLGTQSYIKNLTQLSRLTGQSVRELDAQNRQRSVDGVLQAKLAQMSQEDAIKFQKVLDLFPAGAQQAVQELGLLEAPVSDAAKALQVLSGGAVKEIIDSAMATTGTLSEEATVALSNRIKELGTEIQQGGLADAFATAALAGGDSFFREGNNLITAMAGSAADIKKFTETTAAAQAESPTKALMNVRNALDLNTKALQRVTTAILDALVLDPESTGAKMAQGFVNDAGQFTDEMVDKLLEFFGVAPGKGKEKSEKEPNAFIKFLNRFFSGFGAGATAGDLPQIDPFQANTGTNGFVDFGAGTPAMLHGVEAVVPKNDIGQLANLLAEVGASTTTNTPAGDVITNNTTAMDMTTLNANTEQLIALNEKVANHLNTLVMIGSMTEKNTKETKNNLANMSGSLV